MKEDALDRLQLLMSQKPLLPKLLLWCATAFLLVGLAAGYEEPAASSKSFQIYSNGTVGVKVSFTNWTGYWTTQTTLAAGKSLKIVVSLFQDVGCSNSRATYYTSSALALAFCNCLSRVLRVPIVAGLTLLDENGDTWSSDSDFTVSIAPSDEDSIDLRSESCIHTAASNDAAVAMMAANAVCCCIYMQS